MTASELLKLVEKANGGERELNGMLQCLHRGWRLIRFANDDDYSPAYRDVEPGPQYQGMGGKVGAGTMIFYVPVVPDDRHHHYQLWSGAHPSYTTEVNTALAFAANWFPEYDYVLERTNGGLTISCLLGTLDPNKRVFANNLALAIIAATLKELIERFPDVHSSV